MHSILFVLRYWHQWVVLDSNYRIISNAYTCVELNAYDQLIPDYTCNITTDNATIRQQELPSMVTWISML